MVNTLKKRHAASFKGRVALEAAKQTRTESSWARDLPGPSGSDQPVQAATSTALSRCSATHAAASGTRAWPSKPNSTSRLADSTWTWSG